MKDREAVLIDGSETTQAAGLLQAWDDGLITFRCPMVGEVISASVASATDAARGRRIAGGIHLTREEHVPPARTCDLPDTPPGRRCGTCWRAGFVCRSLER